MGKYFGTDGIRGVANETLNAELAFKLGRYLGYYFTHHGDSKKLIIGKDTRLSSGMLEHAVAAGASSSGADVYLLGVCPTPAVAYCTRSSNACCGVMISASHNPYYDNGIKVFAQDGTKLSEEIENQIENYLDGLIEIDYAKGHDIGRVFDYSDGVDEYLDHLESTLDFDLSGLRLVVDCANGSSCTTAEKMLKRLGAKCTIINDQPEGTNINLNCGSTHPNEVQELIKTADYDLGLCFDGDADRLIAVNPQGELVDGDTILYICGKFMKENKRLNQDVVVTTVMANLGLFKAFDQFQIKYDKTQVGDKYVCKSMMDHDYSLGGEQSGHIIFKDIATTGDGLLTALRLMEVMKKTGKSVTELSEGLKIYPQLLVNVKVSDKQKALEDQEILAAVDQVSAQLGDRGRILVRPSGTEPLVRVMVEAETDELCNQYVYQIVELVQAKYQSN